MAETLIAKLRKTEEGRSALQSEQLILDVSERICELMAAQGISRSELAGKLGVSKARVTNLLSGQANMTLSTLSDIFYQLGRAIHLDDVSRADFSRPSPTSVSHKASSMRISQRPPRNHRQHAGK